MVVASESVKAFAMHHAKAMGHAKVPFGIRLAVASESAKAFEMHHARATGHAKVPFGIGNFEKVTGRVKAQFAKAIGRVMVTGHARAPCVTATGFGKARAMVIVPARK